MMPKVLNKRTDTIPPDAVYVGRPSKWGNPFRIRVFSDSQYLAAVEYFKQDKHDLAYLQLSKALETGKVLPGLYSSDWYVVY